MAIWLRILRKEISSSAQGTRYSHLRQMGIYAALGVSQAITFFMMGSLFAMLTFIASKKLHNVSHLTTFSRQRSPFTRVILQDALNRVMYAPMSFFETTVSIQVSS